MAIPKNNSELLALIRGKPAQVVGACVPIELALGRDGIQKIGEVLDAFFGGTWVGRYLLELGMPPLTMQEERLTKRTSYPSHGPASGVP